MNSMRANLLKPRGWFARRPGVLLALGGWLACLSLPLAANAITNVTVVNVSPAGFTVFCRAVDPIPAIAVFADADGLTNLAGQVGIERFPLHTGNPDLAAGYDRRLGRAALQEKTRSFGLVAWRVTGCRPGTPYYFRLTSTPSGGNPEVFPVSGPLPVAITPSENTFVVNHQQLLIDIPGLDIEGRLVLLTHTNALYPLAAVVGDGVGTNQVFFDVNNLIDATRGGNFTALGSQSFAVDVLGPNQSDLAASFTLNFATNFTVAQATSTSVENEFLAVYVGSSIVLTGQTGGVTIAGNSSAGLTAINVTLELASGHLTNLALSALAPEFNPGASSITPLGGSSWLLHFAAAAGQQFSGAKPLGQLAFTAVAGQASAFVPLTVTGVAATKPDTSAVSQIISQSGRVVVVGQEPLLEALRALDGSRRLQLYARSNATYTIEYANTLSGGNGWTSWLHVPMTNLLATFQPSQPMTPSVFYRAYEYWADPPVLEAQLAADGTRSLRLLGKPGASYAVEYQTGLTGGGGWQLWLRLPLTNSFTTLQPPQPAAPSVFYRAYEFRADPPILAPQPTVDGSRAFLLYGKPGASYAVEYRTNLLGAGEWQLQARVPMTGSFAALPPAPAGPQELFYRAYQFTASPPILEALRASDHTGSVRLYGVPGQSYRLEQTSGLGLAPVWTPGPQLNLTNSFTLVHGLNVTNNLFFRAHQQ